MEITNERGLLQRLIIKLSIASVVTCAAATLVVLASCQKKIAGPVTIEASDMCSFCRMTISEKRYAAEFVDNDGQPYKFDDIGCMANYLKQKNSNSVIAATFVMDFDRREWVNAENAFYVRSSDFRTPMNGGIVAFKDQSSAQAAAAKYDGTMLKFADVTK